MRGQEDDDNEEEEDDDEFEDEEYYNETEDLPFENGDQLMTDDGAGGQMPLDGEDEDDEEEYDNDYQEDDEVEALDQYAPQLSKYDYGTDNEEEKEAEVYRSGGTATVAPYQEELETRVKVA